jgi:hypothetical protein
MKATMICMLPYRHLVHAKIMQEEDGAVHLNYQWEVKAGSYVVY